MAVVAVVALMMFAMRVNQHRLRLAASCGIADRGVRLAGATYRLVDEKEVLQTVRSEAAALTPAGVESRRRRSGHWVVLKRKNDRAATRPWLPVEHDPPMP